MLNVGIVGFGVMGKTHFKCYQAMPEVNVTAICDAGDINIAAQTQASANLGKMESGIDITNVHIYKNFEKMLREENLDLVSITLPTFMHADFTVKALQAGVNVLCEKPMALTIDDCQLMIDAAQKSGKVLQIGHCLRFWPEYVKAKEIINSGEYGQVKAASFQRLSSSPLWSWNNWLQNESKNGGAIMDLHIHDVDIILHWFGIPNSVFSAATAGCNHVMTQYLYPDDKVVTAEAGWLMAPGFGFKMAFNIVLEKATIVFDSTQQTALKIYTFDAKTFTPESDNKDGYWFEIEYFAKTVSGQKLPAIITPQQSFDSVRVALAEKLSAKEHRKVDI